MSKILVSMLAVIVAVSVAQAALVGVDDAFWGESVGAIDNYPAGASADFTGTIDATVVQGWLNGETNTGLAFIPNGPSYYANGQWAIAMAGDNGQGGRFKLIVETVEQGAVTLTHPEAAYINAADPNFHDHTSWQVIPVSGGPKPVLYRWDVSALAGLTVTSASLNLDGNWHEAGALYNVYTPGANWNEATVTYGSLVPEPATLSMLALGGLALIRRRR